MNKHGGYYGNDFKEIIDFSVNINPLGPSKTIQKKMVKALEDVYRYPEIDGCSAIGELSNHLNIDKKNIILGNGAIELIYLLARGINPKKVLLIGPTFNEYRRAFEMNGGKVIEITRKENEDFYIDIDELLRIIERETPEILVLCNPNNPTGDYINPEKLTKVMDMMDSLKGFLIVDESFMDFTEKDSFDKYIQDYNLFILRSMTKFHSLPGIRLGYGLGNEDIIKTLMEYKEPWTMNSIALNILPEVLKDDEFIDKTLKWINIERDFLYRELKNISSIKVYNPEANFLLFKLIKGDPKKFIDYLSHRKIHIRTCHDFLGLGDKYFRISIRLRQDNIKIIEAFKDWARG